MSAHRLPLLTQPRKCPHCGAATTAVAVMERHVKVCTARIAALQREQGTPSIRSPRRKA